MIPRLTETRAIQKKSVPHPAAAASRDWSKSVMIPPTCRCESFPVAIPAIPRAVTRAIRQVSRTAIEVVVLTNVICVLFVTHDIDEAVFMGTRVVAMSARPGRIKLDRRVELPHPRHYSVKTTPQFTELKAELTEQVRMEVRAAAALAN